MAWHVLAKKSDLKTHLDLLAQACAKALWHAHEIGTCTIQKLARYYLMILRALQHLCQTICKATTSRILLHASRIWGTCSQKAFLGPPPSLNLKSLQHIPVISELARWHLQTTLIFRRSDCKLLIEQICLKIPWRIQRIENAKNGAHEIGLRSPLTPCTWDCVHLLTLLIPMTRPSVTHHMANMQDALKSSSFFGWDGRLNLARLFEELFAKPLKDAN